MQSSALTNSGNQLANALFMQRENASCSLNTAPKWGDSLFELFCCHLETHFEVIQEKSAHVDPSTPCNCLQSMLYLCAVSGLVVSRMEAILEHGCFDIVAFLPFLKRDGFNFLCEPRHCPLVLWRSTSKSSFHLDSQQQSSIGLV